MESETRSNFLAPHTASLLLDGKVLATGGLTSTGALTATAKYYADGAPLGTPCSSDSECGSEFCADGVCCNKACAGPCDICAKTLGATADGVCTFAAHGAVGAPPCDASLLCSGTSAACPSACATDADCLANTWCRASDHSCQPDQANGASCTSASQCASAHCVDGVCCDGACSDLCAACNAARKGHGLDGACEAIGDGLDPEAECPSQGTDAACVSDGVCNGAGQCRASSKGNVCGATSCASSTTQTNAPACDASGACATQGTTECVAYVCDGTTCRTDCTGDTHCLPGFYCSGGSCVPSQSNGAACTGGSQCTSGHCADGVCCNHACEGVCLACSASKKGSGVDGDCGAIAAGSDPDDECTTDNPSTCQKDGTCDGQGACRLYGGNTSCGVSVCIGNAASSKRCDGTGQCVADATTVACEPYICTEGACATSCASDSQCASGS